MDEQKEIAIEELKLLSSIIGRNEELIYKRQAVLFTSIIALTAALGGNFFDRHQFHLYSCLLIFVFYVADILQRIPVGRAIERSRRVEVGIRRGKNPQSPQISNSVSPVGSLTKRTEKLWREFKICARRPRVLAPYAVTLFIVAFIWYEAPSWFHKRTPPLQSQAVSQGVSKQAPCLQGIYRASEPQ